MPRRWTRVSATQLKVAQLCPRKWWFERISDLPSTPPTAAMLQGKAIHEQVEAWLKEGTPPVDARAAALARLYPARLVHTSPLVKSEQEVTLQHGLPVPLLGFVDLLDARVMPHAVEVVDFKSVSAWKYAKTAEELQEDLQMVPYAVWVMEHHRPHTVQVSHVAVHKVTCEVATTTASLSPRAIHQTWTGVIVPLAHRMAGWATAPAPQEVPATPSACSAFGGCPYASVCDRGGATTPNTNPSPFGAMSRIRASTVPQSTQGDTPMSKLQELIRARSLAAASNTPPPGPAPQPPSHVTTTSTSLEDAQQRVEDARVRLAQAEAGGSPLPDEPGLQHAVEAAAPRSAPARDPRAAYPAALVSLRAALGERTFIPAKELRLLIGAELGLARVAWSHVEAVAHDVPGWTLDLTGLQRNVVPPASVVQVVDEPTDPQQYVDTAARASVEAVAPDPIVVAPVAPDPIVVARAIPPVGPAGPAGFMLLVDVGVVQAPQGWKLQTLEAYLAPIVARYEASVGGPAFLRDFRAGERTVAHMASLDLPADGTVLLVDSLNSVWKEVSQALVPRASGILRGLR